MGSPAAEPSRGDDEFLHPVRLTRGFWCGVYPVTQAEWRAVMGIDPSMFSEDLLGPDAGGGWDDRPVESVSWDDANEFCDRLKETSGVPVRLPTEAEWEYACRGGTTTPFYWGATADGSQANCDGTAPYGSGVAGENLWQTAPVGRYAAEFPHPWGLADVHGNVLEWCADWHDTGYYRRSPADDPECRDGERTRRVLRGGCWANHPHLCRSAKRWMLPPGVAAQFQSGFRVVFHSA